MFNIKKTKIAGCIEIQPISFQDNRGRFVKVFHALEFEKHYLSTRFMEEFYSSSEPGVLRGLHFQTPPHEHEKLVYCVQGEVFDVVLDLRVGSPTYGQAQHFILNAVHANMLYIPAGLAHGFCTMSEAATLVYKVTSVHAPAYDQGILWSSIPIDWPVNNPIVSDRDSKFPTLAQFASPFAYEKLSTSA
ncbi:MAG: dTDP-4-dehydrorhamnose 3,5-epimerase [Flammeovirgaceae bacterium]